MKITNLSNVEKKPVEMEYAANVIKQVPLSKNDGAPHFSFRVFTIGPSGYTPHHAHVSEHLTYVIEGRGVIVTEGGEERPVEKGDFAMILPNEKHQFKNVSAEDALVLLCAVPVEFE